MQGSDGRESSELGVVVRSIKSSLLDILTNVGRFKRLSFKDEALLKKLNCHIAPLKSSPLKVFA